MKKIIVDNNFFNKIIPIDYREKKISEFTTFTTLYLLPNNEILKTFYTTNPMIFNLLNQEIEEKVLLSSKITVSPNVILPTSAIYNQSNQFIGYTTPIANGYSFNQINKKLTKEDNENLYRYAKIHSKIEKTVKESSDIVFPDLNSDGNILIDENNNIKIIDYDGYQIKNISTYVLSNQLGNEEQYINSKKYYQNELFTKQLDIKSLILLFFLDVFHIDLNDTLLSQKDTTTNIILDRIFNEINLFDDDINHKIWKIFNENATNEYLGDDIFKIADKYNLTAIKHPSQKGIYIKKLIKK